MSASYTPLHGPDKEPPIPAPVDLELQLARECLDKVADANIHDDEAMIRAAAGLNYRLRALVAALDAERGEGR
ncbi:hypothetical protein [Streptomyces sp. NPDC002758]